jgi:hypothetical protein
LRVQDRFLGRNDYFGFHLNRMRRFALKCEAAPSLPPEKNSRGRTVPLKERRCERNGRPISVTTR